MSATEEIKKIEKAIIFGKDNETKYVDLYYSKGKLVKRFSKKARINSEIAEEICENDEEYNLYKNKYGNEEAEEFFNIKIFKDVISKKYKIDMKSVLKITTNLVKMTRTKEMIFNKSILMKNDDLFIRVIFTNTQCCPIIKIYSAAEAFKSPLSLSEDDNSNSYIMFSSYGKNVDVSETLTQYENLTDVKVLTAEDIYLNSLKENKRELIRKEK